MVRWWIRRSRLTLRGDQVPICSSPTKLISKKRKTFRVGGLQSPFSISSSFILFCVSLPFFLKTKKKKIKNQPYFKERYRSSNSVFSMHLVSFGTSTPSISIHFHCTLSSFRCQLLEWQSTCFFCFTLFFFPLTFTRVESLFLETNCARLWRGG